ncbi:hypothetical protein EDC01DRAFT_631155 [Geopyxis carbonaria]|nr:hypothetical protein EDC01DRAFT_631155 [Geopyxis carbonaria]
MLEQHMAITDPGLEVFVVQGWDQTIIKEMQNFDAFIQALAGHSYVDLLMADTKTVILFDEAPMTYWDKVLWTEFFKSNDGTLGPRIIVFYYVGFAASTSSILDEEDDARIPLRLVSSQDISLAPEGSHQLGLLLGPEEAYDVIRWRLDALPDPNDFDDELDKFPS